MLSPSGLGLDGFNEDMTRKDHGDVIYELWSPTRSNVDVITNYINA